MRNVIGQMAYLPFLERLLSSCVTLRIDKITKVYHLVLRSKMLPRQTRPIFGVFSVSIYLHGDY